MRILAVILVLLQGLDARIPSRTYSRIGGRFSSGLGGRRLQGAGLHKTPTKMEDLSWWPEQTRHKVQRPAHRRPKRSHAAAFSWSNSDDKDECLLMLSFTTCLVGLSLWVNREFDKATGVVFADGEPSAVLV